MFGVAKTLSLPAEDNDGRPISMMEQCISAELRVLMEHQVLDHSLTNCLQVVSGHAH